MSKKKVFTFILAICMIISMLGSVVTAFAAYSCDCEHTHSVENGCYAGCTVEYDLSCDKEHAHNDACKTAHVHTEACTGIICTITAEEDAEHVHGEACSGLICGKTEEDMDIICGKEEHAHSEVGGECYVAHVHTAECLSCTKKEYHIHTKACFTGTWPDTKNPGKEPICGKEEHNHNFLCMSKADIEAIEAAYPSSKHKVPEYEEPYVFMEAQTYINSGYRFIKNNGTNSYPQLFMMGDVSGMEPGEYWTQPGGKRFEVGESNYAVVYCCDRQTSAKQYVMYRQVNLEDANYYGGSDAQKIRSIVMNSYPYISIEEAQQRLIAAGYKDAKKLDETDLVCISQLAVWHYANGGGALDHTYLSTAPSGKYPAITPFWKKGDAVRWSGNRAAECEKAYEYLVAYAAAHPVEAPKSQTVVSQVEVTNLSMAEEENGTCTVDLQISLNTDYSPKNGTAITITATAGEATASVNATGGKTYALQLKDYVKGTPIDIEMKGTQYLPKGVYFYEPYAAEGQDPRKVAQNMVGVNEGAVPVGDKVT
ncbi:MAG: thioester domain-containing protein, partial [Christensenellaceae bacterium]|nr:thioester domain-containing protein [Christensenellaceae bacterium]